MEETLSDALEDDSFDLSILENSSQTDSPTSSVVSEMPTPDVSALTSEHFMLLPDASDMSTLSMSPAESREPLQSVKSKMSFTEFDAESTEMINEKAWGEELNNRSTSSQHNQSSTSNKFTRHMSNKLFRNSNFSKRNPRKSLSRNSFGGSQSSHSLQSSSQKDALPDLEAILSQKSRQSKDNTENIEPMATQQVATASKHIDQDWLERCNDLNDLDGDRFELANDSMSQPSSHPQSQQTPQSQAAPRTFGISNIKSTVLTSLQIEQAETVSAPKTMVSMDVGNLDLSTMSSFSETPAPRNVHHDDNDDEEVANSEDESIIESKPQIRSARHSLKRKHSEISETKRTSLSNNQKPPSSDKLNAPTERRSIVSVNKRASVKREVPDIVVKELLPERRSTRNAPDQKAKTYKEVNECNTDDSSNENEDVFAGDDSDNDPNFTMEAELNKLSSLTSMRKSTSSNSSDDQDEPPPSRKPIAKPRQRVARTKSTKTTTKTARAVRTRQSIKTVPSRKSVTNAKPQVTSDNETEPANEESPEDYLPEFGVETIKNKPSIALAELKQHSLEFSKYVAGVHSSVPIVSTAAVVRPLSTQNSQAKDKLEKKIASGTLNENYVRLNLRKKIFVRGKKTMNFSRYKKKLWKSKKAEAISGPDMDMRGCDGGILTCFQCGMPGHFAQNCKLQSDRLMPLDAENNDSQFPTLREVADMAKQKIALAHGGKEIPQTDNPSWNNEEPTNVLNENDESEMEQSEKVQEAPAPYIGHKIPQDFLIKAGLLNNAEDGGDDFQPLYRLNPDGSTPGENHLSHKYVENYLFDFCLFCLCRHTKGGL